MRVTLDFPAAEEILQEVGLDEQGDAQMFHTKNVLRRIQKYMPYRTGATIKLNGIVETPGLWEAIGHTLAQGLNTALLFYDTFMQTFHWASLGAGLAAGLTQQFAGLALGHAGVSFGHPL